MTSPSADRADRAARVAVAARLLAGAVLGHVGGGCEQPCVSAVSRDQVGEPVLTRLTTFRALDPQKVELADQVAEDDRAVVGHYDIDLLNSLSFVTHEKMIFGACGSQTEPIS